MPTSQYDGRRLTPGAVRAEQKYLKENPWARKDGGLVVNAGIAKEAYFRNYATGRGNTGFWKIAPADSSENAPVQQFSVAALWNPSVTAKGMISTSDITSPTYEDPRGSSYKVNRFQKYGFQFHYNPTTIQMAYAGNPDFDITMLTSGRDAYNLLGSAATQSTISFNIILNRINDMKYFTTQGIFKSDVTQTKWAGKFPTPQEQLDIWEKGTMYDVEFFLRAVMQVTQKAAYNERNSFDGKTADLGFLTGVPVDLFLGRSLRYWVRVDSFTLNHIIFNERMVPLFTEMAITCSRIPDYADDRNVSSSTVTGTTNQGVVIPGTEGFSTVSPGQGFTLENLQNTRLFGN